MARTTAGRRPAPPAPSPAPRAQRTPGDFVRALGALLALAVLLVGVPAALAYLLGWPLPRHFSLDALRQPITSETFVDVLAVVVWLAWAQFAACVVVEAKAAVSGIGMPGRVPASGASQLLARQLIAALLLVTATAAGLAPGLAQLGHAQHEQPHRSGATAAAQQTPGGGQGRQQASGAQRSAVAGQSGAAAVGDPGARATKFYSIQPPEGRHHDSLWEIAQRHLGDGRRYKEIYDLNKDRVQPDGSRLSQASLIRPGWIMELPADAHGAGLVEVSALEAQAHPPSAPARAAGSALAAQSAASRPAHSADQPAGTSAAVARTPVGGTVVGAPSARTAAEVERYAERGGAADTAREAAAPLPAPAAPAPAPAPAAVPDSPAQHGTSGFDLPEALIGAPLLAAGLLAALGRRRRTALWQSVAVGALRTPRTPAGTEADAADALRIGADPDTVAFLDRALRALSVRLDADGAGLPTVYAAWLTPDALHLQLAWPEGRPPAPWQLGQDQTFWRLDRADLPADADASAAAPYPGLASLGTLDGARLLLNLEAVPGIVSLTGPRAEREAVLASLAAELATNGWSDRMTVTLVGFAEDLTALAPTRIRHLADVAEAVETMAAETAQRAGALRTAGQDGVLTGRTGRAQHTQRAPHLVLVAAEPTEAEAARLAQLAADSGRLGIGYLVATSGRELPGAAWELEVTAAGRLLAPLLGLDIEAQRLPAPQYAALLRLFADAAPGDGPSGPGPQDGGPGPDAPPFLVDLTDQGRPGVYARLLGTFELVGLDAPAAERSPLLHEALALLLLHREGVHPRVLAAALWPRGVTEDVRDALIDRLRDWLGADQDGSSRLSHDAAGRLVLATSVVSDWDVLQTLHHRAAEPSAAADPQLRGRLLADALGLARGQLLADRAPDRYGWLAHEIVDAQHPVLVAEVALALSSLHLDAGKPKAAVAAVETGLGIAGADERLWLQLLRAAAAIGDPARLAAAADSLTVRNRTLHGAARGLPPRVEALLDDLHPDWRSRTAN